MKPICIFLLLLLVCASIADAQPMKIAALERQVERTKSEKLRLERLVELAEMLEFVHPVKALERGREALALAERRGDSLSAARAYSLIGVSLFLCASIDSGKAALNQSVLLARSLRDTSALCGVYARWATHALSRGALEEATESCRKGIELARHDSVHLCRLLLVEDIIEHRRAPNDNSRKERLQRLLKLAESLGDAESAGLAHRRLAGLLWYRREVRSALEHGRRSIHIYDSLGQTVCLATALALMSDLEVHRPEYALEVAATAVRLLESIGDRLELPSALIDLSEKYLSLGDLDSARHCAERSLTIATQNRDANSRARSFMCLGWIQRTSGHYDASIDTLKLALKECETYGLQTYVPNIYGALVRTHEESGEFAQAIEWGMTAIEWARKAGLPDDVSNFSSVIGCIHLKSDRFDDALEFFKRAARIAEEAGFQDEYAFARAYIGTTYSRMGRHDEAINCLLESARLYEKLGNVVMAINTYADLVNEHYTLSRWEGVMVYCDIILALCEQSGTPQSVANTYMGNVLWVKAQATYYVDQVPDALAIFQLALMHALLHGDSLLALSIEKSLCSAYLMLGLDDEAILVLRRMESRYKHFGVSASRNITLGFAHALSNMQRWEASLEYLHRVVSASMNSSPSEEIEALFRIGDAQRALRQEASALETYQHCLALIEHHRQDPTKIFGELADLREERERRERMAWFQHSEKGTAATNEYLGLRLLDRTEGVCREGIGWLFVGQGRIDEARAHFQTALDLAQRRGFPPGDAIEGLAQCYQADGEFEQALALLQLSIETDSSDFLQQRERLFSIATLHAQLGQWQQAIETLARAAVMGDHLRNTTRNRRVFALHAKFGAELKDAEIRQRAAQRELDEATLRLRQDSLALVALELRKKESALRLQHAEAEELRLRAALLEREHEVQALELARRTAERNARQADAVAAESRLRLLEKKRAHAEAIAAGEQRVRNGLLGGVGLLALAGLLGIKRVRDRRTAAALRAEAAEYRARTVEAQAVAQEEQNERREKEAQRVFSRRLIASQEAERKRIAVELHDGISQELIVIKNRATLALDRSAAPSQVRDCLDDVAAMSATALEDVRRISRDLRPVMIDQVGLATTLRSALQKAAAASGLRLTVHIGEIDGLLAREDEMKVYRIVQEAVANILKHAHASEASLTLLREEGTAQPYAGLTRNDGAALRLRISDNGVGFDTGARRQAEPSPVVRPEGGLGLRSMAERVAMLGGTFDVRSSPGEGTTLTITIPVASVAENDRAADHSLAAVEEGSLP